MWPFVSKEPFILREKEFFHVPFSKGDDSIVAGFTTRNGGVSLPPYTSLNMGFHVQDVESAVKKNREIVASKIGFPLQSWIVGEQVHGAQIQKVTVKDTGSGAMQVEDAIKGVDGLYTNEPNILLTSLYADCVPLYFVSPKTNFIGLAHAGWRGTVGAIGPRMIDLWTEKEGVPLEDIHCVIGPAIGKQQYEVDQKVIDEVKKVCDSHFTVVSENKFLLDLQQVNRTLIEKAGIPAENIRKSSYCTASNLEFFFSHRKEKGKTGRMMSFIGRRSV